MAQEAALEPRFWRSLGGVEGFRGFLECFIGLCLVYFWCFLVFVVILFVSFF